MDGLIDKYFKSRVYIYMILYIIMTDDKPDCLIKLSGDSKCWNYKCEKLNEKTINLSRKYPFKIESTLCLSVSVHLTFSSFSNHFLTS